MTLRSSLNAAVRLPEISGRLAHDLPADAQPAAMTVTVQVTLPRAGVEAARLAESLGADSLEIAAHLAERLHTIAATRARELIPSAGVSTTVSMVTQSMETEVELHAAGAVPTRPAMLLPPAQRAPTAPRLVGAGPSTGELYGSLPAVEEAAAPPAASDAPPLQILGSRREALLDGVALALTRREYELLVFLAERPGRVFTRRQLLSRVWGEDVVSGERTVDVHVRRLRAKLRRRGPVITTIRGVGYRMDRAERVTVS